MFAWRTRSCRHAPRYNPAPTTTCTGKASANPIQWNVRSMPRPRNHSAMMNMAVTGPPSSTARFQAVSAEEGRTGPAAAAETLAARYPAFATAATTAPASARDGSDQTTLAVPLARSTCVLATPGSPLSAFRTACAQLPQVIPSTRNSSGSGGATGRAS